MSAIGLTSAAVVCAEVQSALQSYSEMKIRAKSVVFAFGAMLCFLEIVLAPKASEPGPELAAVMGIVLVRRAIIVTPQPSIVIVAGLCPDCTRRSRRSWAGEYKQAHVDFNDSHRERLLLQDDACSESCTRRSTARQDKDICNPLHFSIGVHLDISIEALIDPEKAKQSCQKVDRVDRSEAGHISHEGVGPDCCNGWKVRYTRPSFKGP